MAPHSLGKVTAPPGTPACITGDQYTPVAANKIGFQPAPTNAAPVYLGLPAMDPATGAGVLREFKPGDPFWELDADSNANQLYVNNYFVAALLSTDGLIVSYW